MAQRELQFASGGAVKKVGKISCLIWGRARRLNTRLIVIPILNAITDRPTVDGRRHQNNGTTVNEHSMVACQCMADTVAAAPRAVKQNGKRDYITKLHLDYPHET